MELIETLKHIKGLTPSSCVTLSIPSSQWCL